MSLTLSSGGEVSYGDKVQIISDGQIEWEGQDEVRYNGHKVGDIISIDHLNSGGLRLGLGTEGDKHWMHEKHFALPESIGGKRTRIKAEPCNCGYDKYCAKCKGKGLTETILFEPETSNISNA